MQATKARAFSFDSLTANAAPARALGAQHLLGVSVQQTLGAHAACGKGRKGIARGNGEGA